MLNLKHGVGRKGKMGLEERGTWERQRDGQREGQPETANRGTLAHERLGTKSETRTV